MDRAGVEVLLFIPFFISALCFQRLIFICQALQRQMTWLGMGTFVVALA